MSFREFLLSEKRSVWLLRHLAFWTFWGLYFSIVKFFSPLGFYNIGHLPSFFDTMRDRYLWLAPQAFLVYPLIYFVLPRYVFRGRYVGGFIFSIIFWLLSLTMNALILLFVDGNHTNYSPNSDWLNLDGKTMLTILRAYFGGLNGGLAAAALAA